MTVGLPVPDVLGYVAATGDPRFSVSEITVLQAIAELAAVVAGFDPSLLNTRPAVRAVVTGIMNLAEEADLS